MLEILFGFYLVLSLAMTAMYLEEEKRYNYYPSLTETLNFLLKWPVIVYRNIKH